MMNRKKLCILMIILGVCSTFGWAANHGTDKVGTGFPIPQVQIKTPAKQHDTLAGLESVIVVAQEPPPDAKAAGLTGEQIQNDVELKLKLAGLEVLSKDDLSAEPNTPTLNVSVYIVPQKDTQMYAVSVSLKLQQPVTLAREPNVVVVANTWEKASLSVFDKQIFVSAVRAKVKEQVSFFIRDFRAANRKPEETYQNSHFSGIEDIPSSDMVWVKCLDPNCGAEYQMRKRDYFQYLVNHQDPMSIMAPAIVCNKCGKETVYRAEKCAKCGLVFRRSSIPHDFADRCPECGYSSTEDMRKKARQRRTLHED
jgi:predicted RNA-binding Zn-ribbon protein involved in translation (DUF1610 family)